MAMINAKRVKNGMVVGSKVVTLAKALTITATLLEDAGWTFGGGDFQNNGWFVMMTEDGANGMDFEPITD